MKKKYVISGLISFLVLFIIFPVFSEYDPPPGISSLYDLYSPSFLAGGSKTVSTLSPAGDVLNPAASGARQRVTLDLSYIGLVGSDEDSGFGHVINTGLTLPTRAGVFSSSARFVSTPFDSVELGTFGGLNVSFAKDLFPRLLVGAGLGAMFGSDWGLGLDLGFVHLPGELGFFKDFRWGVAIKGLGKGFAPVEGRTAYPAPFTPSIGAYFGLIDSKAFDLAFTADLIFPGFQNLQASLGTELTFKDFLFVQAGAFFDAHEFLKETSRNLPVSFGLALRFATSIRQDRSEVKTSVSAAPLQNDIWAVGAGVNVHIGVVDKDPPVINIDTATENISPNLDGVQDDLNKSVQITDERFIKGYRFIVYDSQGVKVREIVNKDERPENVTVKNIVDRLLYVKKGITIPEQLRWDGRTDKGSVAPDGNYTFQVEAWDDNGNLGKSDTGSVIVDNTPPSVELNTPYLIFSPNDDGNKDVLPVEQKGSEEILWHGTVQNVDGEEIVSLKWKNSDPQNFDWDGRNSGEILSPDGVYNYRITSTDRAGNTGSAQIDNIIISTQATPININISESFFSPNGDQVKDTLIFTLDVPVTSGIEKWSLSISDEQGTIRRIFKGTESIFKALDFDGTDNEGKKLPEGTYDAELEVLYVNGNNPNALSPSFTIDLTPPSAVLSSDLAVFSPNGDGIKDTVTIYQESSVEPEWEGILTNAFGQTVRSFSWRGRVDSKMVWEGRSDDGRLMPDGIYSYFLRATDKAGNFGESKKIQFEVNTEETEVFISTDSGYFSPNADGVKDRIKLISTLKVTSGVESFHLRILDQSKQVVKNVRGQNRAPDTLAWDGLDDNGRRLPDGEYVAELELDYLKGDHHEVRTPSFIMDTKEPTIEISVDFTLFSPDGDGLRDEVTIRQSSSRENLWEAEIRDSREEEVRSFYWKGQASTFKWDGKDENGNKIADGLYSYRVRCIDPAGNSVSKEIRGLEIDTRLTPLFITVSADGFSPNYDGFLDKIEFNTYVEMTDGIKSWHLDLIHSKQGVKKRFSGVGKIPSNISWDGRGDYGAAPEGFYQALFTVEYNKGNRPEEKTAPFRLDISPPMVDFTLTPRPFSPDNDGVDDELNIGIGVEDLSPIAGWAMEINDPVGHLFTTFSGRGNPTDRIIWDGLSDSGELVQAAQDYRVFFRINDTLGNSTDLERIIPVDVLVIREGDKLKVRISSITFPPNSADLSAVEDGEKIDRNNRTIKRLAEIFTKYSKYRIRIEGHANNLSWADPVKAAEEEIKELGPLSNARAEAVKTALVELGLQASRISTAGLGGKHPIVPFRDLENRWKNRRVEFILIKK